MYQPVLVGTDRYKPIRAVRAGTKSGTEQARTNSVKPPERSVPAGTGTKPITLVRIPPSLNVKKYLYAIQFKIFLLKLRCFGMIMKYIILVYSKCLE